MPPNARQSGNVFFALFGAVALVGVVGASVTTILKGPVAGMQRVTKYTVAENNMIAAGKLALIAATNQPLSGDCDADDMVEPIPFSTTGDGPFPAGGGYLPAEIGATRQDPWGNIYGYCVWDHGIDPEDPTDNDGECGGNTNFRAGADSEQYIALAVISSGPDRIFQSSCNDFDPENPEAPLVVKSAGSDDVVLAYTYAEAGSMSGGLWKLKSGDSSTAEVGNRNVEIAGSGGGDAARIGYDEGLEMSGVGEFLAIKTDHIFSRTSSGEVNMESPLRVKLMDELEKPMGVAGEGVGTKSVIAPGLRRKMPTMPIAPDGQDWADAIVCGSNVAERPLVYELILYYEGNANGDIAYRFSGSSDSTVYYFATGVRGTTTGNVAAHGDHCPASYNEAIKVYYGSGGGGNVPSILPGWPDALRCGTFDGSGVGSILYLEGSASGHFRYTRPYSHAASGGTGSYSLTFSPDGAYHGEGGGADTMYANCKNKSITTLVEEGKGIFFGGGTGGGAGAGTGGGGGGKPIMQLFAEGYFRDITTSTALFRPECTYVFQRGNGNISFNVGINSTRDHIFGQYQMNTGWRVVHTDKATGITASSSVPGTTHELCPEDLPSGDGSGGSLTSKAGLDGAIWPDALVCTESDGTQRAFKFNANAPGDGNLVVYSFLTSSGEALRMRYNAASGEFASFSASSSHTLDQIVQAGDPCRTSVQAVSAAGKSASYGGGGGSGGGASTMVPNWPDAIVCKGSGGADGNRPLFLSFASNTGATYRRITNGSDNLLSFDASGNYDSHTSMNGYDCVSGAMSISALYAANQAFKFVGGGSGGSGGAGIRFGGVYTAAIEPNQTLTNACEATPATLTIPEAGMYQVNLVAQVYQYSGDTARLYFRLLDADNNPVMFVRGSKPQTAAGYVFAQGAELLELSAGDYTLSVQSMNSGTCATSSINRILNATATAKQILGSLGASGESGGDIWSTSGSNIHYTGGNVGIGMSNPETRLHLVDGSIMIGSPTDGVGYNAQLGRNNWNFNRPGSISYINQHGIGGDIRFRMSNAAQNDTTALTLLSSGSVGVGTTSPEGILHAHSTNGDNVFLVSSRGNTLRLGTDTDIPSYIRFRPSSGTGVGITGNNDTVGLFVDASNSYVGIRTAGPTHVLHVNGVARSTQASFATSSDQRVKENVHTIDNGLSTILRLRPVTYEYTAEYQNGNVDMAGSRRGFIAQEIEAVLPEAVTQGKETFGDEVIEDFRILKNDEFVPLLVRAVQEIKALFDDLSAKVAALFAEITGLKEADKVLEAGIVELRAANDILRADNDRLREELTDINKRLQKLEAAQ